MGLVSRVTSTPTRGFSLPPTVLAGLLVCVTANWRMRDDYRLDKTLKQQQRTSIGPGSASTPMTKGRVLAQYRHLCSYQEPFSFTTFTLEGCRAFGPQIRRGANEVIAMLFFGTVRLVVARPRLVD